MQNAITLKTENADKLVFEFTVDYEYMLTTTYGQYDPTELLEIDFGNDQTATLTYDLTVFLDPNSYYFATRISENGYGSDCADYSDTDDIAHNFGQPIADFVTAELTRRNLPLVASRNWPAF